MPPTGSRNSPRENDGGSPKPAGGEAGAPRRRSRRHLEKELNLAARHRRQITANSNYHHPPKLEDIWICEFCEYERIFGEPPRALIRDYELKDRRIRQEVAERKRMLDKVKAKARKGKKGGKAPVKGGGTPGQAPENPQFEAADEPGAIPGEGGGGQSTQSEEDYEAELDDNYPTSPPQALHDSVHAGGRPIPLRGKT
jgi:hypothetical protein